MKYIFLTCVALLSTTLWSTVVPDGTFDQLFGNVGRVTTETIDDFLELTSIAVQNDGKYVCAGRASVDAGSVQLLARFTKDGLLDTSFGTNGVVINPAVLVSFGTGLGLGYKLVLYPDGRILVADSLTNIGTITIARYTNQGAIDTTFGAGTGFVTLDPGLGVDLVSGLSLLDETILVSAIQTVSNLSYIFSLRPDGSLDTTFGVGGIVTVSFATVPQPNVTSLVVDRNRKIVVGGYNNAIAERNSFVARYLSTGAVDTTFGTSQGVTRLTGTNERAFSMIVQDDGKILQAGMNFASTSYVSIQYSSDGLLDASYGQAGISRFTLPNTTSVTAVDSVLQADGKQVIIGRVTLLGANNFVIIRLMPDGSIDNSFGRDGVVYIPYVGTGALNSCAIDQNNAILAVGAAASGMTRISSLFRLRVDSVQTSVLSSALWQRYYNQNNH